MKRFCAVAVPVLALLFAANLAIAQTPPAAAEPAGETGAVHQEPPTKGPIVLNWKLKKLDGTMNLTVNADGTYLFSGQVKDKRPDRDMDMSVALKSSLGGVVIFTNIGNMAEGLQWSKQGQSDILKDNFSTFAGKHEWTWEYRLPLSSEGRAKLYKEKEEKKARMKKEEREKEEKKEAEEQNARLAQQRSQQQPQQGGGGGSLASTISSIGNTISSTVNDVSSAIQSAGSTVESIIGMF